MVAIACSFAASTPIQARVARSNSASARSKDDARLVVTRAANFGTFQYLILFVDGVQVADLGLGQSYDAVLAPGQHVLSVSTTPQIYRRTPPTQRRVNLEPGETYTFTAFWKNSYRAYLREERQHQENHHTEQPGWLRLKERASYTWTLEQARKDNNAQAVKELEALQPYPGDFAIEKIDGERKWAVHYGGLFYRHQDGDFYFHLARISPDYMPADRQAWGDGSAYTVKIVEPQLAAASFARLDRLDCPVFMFEGRHDEVVPSMITAAWLDKLKAPTKATVWFENSAHMMMIEEPGRVLDALLRSVRPCANSGEKDMR